jgi:hypothetical protein
MRTRPPEGACDAFAEVLPSAGHEGSAAGEIEELVHEPLLVVVRACRTR